MNYINYTDEIDKNISQVKLMVDGFTKIYLDRKSANKIEIEKMEKEGKYTKEFIEEYKKNQVVKSEDIHANVTRLRKETLSKVNPIIDSVERELDAYINAPVNEEFATKLNSIKTLGLQLSDREFQILQQKANTYMERRLLNQLAESRTKDAATYKVSDNAYDAYSTVEYTEKNNPYFGVEMPNIDELYDEFNEYKRAVINAVENYVGENAELYEVFSPKGETPDDTYAINRTIAMSFGKYWSKDTKDRFVTLMDKVSSILPKNETRALTDADREYLDAIIDVTPGTYPHYCETRVRQLYKLGGEVATLIRSDERYAKYIEDIA